MPDLNLAEIKALVTVAVMVAWVLGPWLLRLWRWLTTNE